MLVADLLKHPVAHARVRRTVQEVGEIVCYSWKDAAGGAEELTDEPLLGKVCTKVECHRKLCLCQAAGGLLVDGNKELSLKSWWTVPSGALV